MAFIVVRDERTIENHDAAEVWALVADLARFGEWFPVHNAISMTGDLPQVGNIIFLSPTRRSDPAAAIRLEVRAWEAGRRFECDVREVPGIEEGRFSVTVTGLAGGAATVTLSFVGEGAGIAARISGYEIGRRFRGALDRLAS